MVDFDRQAVKGDLPDDVFTLIDWDRLHWYCQEAVLGQPAESRSAILSTEETGEKGGALVDVKLKPFTADGTLWVYWQGQPLLKLHVSRLMPWNPMALDEMETR